MTGEDVLMRLGESTQVAENEQPPRERETNKNVRKHV